MTTIQALGPKGLDRILSPLAGEDFMGTWFDTKPLFIAGRHDKFSELPLSLIHI